MAKYQEATVGQVEAVINRMGGYANWKKFAGGEGRIRFGFFEPSVGKTHFPGNQKLTTTLQSFWDAGVKFFSDMVSLEDGSEVDFCEREFKDNFLGLEVEEGGCVELVCQSVGEASKHDFVVGELGGEEGVAISVAHLLYFLKSNKPDGETQASFCFYLYGKNQELCAVHASWFGDKKRWSLALQHFDPWSGQDDLGVGAKVVSLRETPPRRTRKTRAK